MAMGSIDLDRDPGGYRRFGGTGFALQNVVRPMKWRWRLLIMAVLALPIVPLTWWALDERMPIVPIGGSTLPDNAPPGASVKVYYRGEVRRNDDECDVSLARTWVDAKGFSWPLMAVGLPYDIGFKDIGLTMAVPMDAAKGPAALKSILVWKCNPLQQLFPRTTELPMLSVNVLR